MARTDREGRLSVFFHHVFKTRIGSRTVMALLFFVQEDVLPQHESDTWRYLRQEGKETC